MIRRIWQFLSRPLAMGLVLVGAGVLWMVAPLSAEGAAVDSGWWTEPFRSLETAGIGMALMALVAVFAIAGLWSRISQSGSLALTRHGRPAGLAIAVLGIAVVIVHWYVLMSEVASDRVTLQPGDQIQAYETVISGVRVDRMLPVRVAVENVDFSSAQPRADLRFVEAGSDEPIRDTVKFGEGVNVQGIRVTPIGFDESEASLVGRFRGVGDDTITASVAAGQTFQVKVDGATYRVEEIVRHYMGAVGAAAKISEPDGDSYWVFRQQTIKTDGQNNSRTPRPDRAELQPDFEHAVKLTDLREVPATVVAITPVQPLWPLSVGGLIYMCGVGLIVGVGRPGSSETDDASREGSSTQS